MKLSGIKRSETLHLICTKRRCKDFVGMAAEKKSFKDSTFFSLLHGMLEFYLLHLNTLNAPPLFSIPGGTNSITFEGTFMNKSTKESALQCEFDLFKTFFY